MYFYADIFDSVTYINKLSLCAFFNIQFDDSVERILVSYCGITVCEQLKENEPWLIHTRTLIL